MIEQTIIDELTEKNQQLQATLDHVGAYIFTKDTDGRYTYANRLVCELFGYPLHEILGYTDEKFFDLSVYNQLRLNDRRVLDFGERVESEEINVISETGETRVYWTIKIPWYNADGVITGIYGLSTDITERRLLETRVQEQKLLLDTILNNIDAHVYMKNAEGRYLYANQHTAELLGLPLEAIVGQLEAEIIPKHQAEQFAALDRQLFATGQKICTEEVFTDTE